MDISGLFRTKNTQKDSDTSALMYGRSMDSKRPAETYVQYGKRICGTVTGSLAAFNVMLQKIYNAEKQSQIEDKALQELRRTEICKKIDEADSDIAKEKAKQVHVEEVINDYEQCKSDLGEQYVEAKHLHGQINKMARMKMMVGALILIPLTVYLFSFYTGIFAQGFSGLDALTIYLAPMIFFGLGFALHFFSVQENKTKYLKIAAVLIATFSFDCILAYDIAAVQYNEWANNQITVVPPYSVQMAVTDVHVWTVLFGGFVAYIIWGIVFDMTMTAYEELRSNKKEMEQIMAKITDVKAKIREKREELLNVKNRIIGMEAEKKKFKKELDNNVHVDLQVIRTALSDFQAGWIGLMSSYGAQNEAYRVGWGLVWLKPFGVQRVVRIR